MAFEKLSLKYAQSTVEHEQITENAQRTRDLMFFFGHIRVTSGRSYIRRALKQAMEIQCLWRALGGWVAAGHTHACKIHAVTLRCVNAFVCVFFEGISATATGDTTLLIFRPG